MLQPVERAINLINPVGLYQKLMVVYLFFIAGFVNYMIMGPTLTFMNPLFSCSFSQELVDESDACPRIDQCTVANDFTIVSEMGLYCDRQVERNLIQSISSLGAILGLILINYISDAKGKKVGIILALLVGSLAILLTVVGGYTQSVWLLVLSQFISGFCSYSMIILAYILPSEFSTEEFKEKAIVIINYAWSLTSMLLGVLFYLKVQWYNFLILFVLIPMLGVTVLSFFFILEGPNFLYRNKREKECLQTLKTIALYNNKMKQYEQVLINFRYESTEQQKEQNTTSQALKLIWKDKVYRKLVLILVLAEIGGNLYYMATNYALDVIGFDYGTNMLGTGAIEFLSFVYLQFKIKSLPRREAIFWLYVIISSLGLLFFIDPIVNNGIVSFAIIGVIRFFSTVAYALIVMILTERFPMEIQGICAGVIESLAQVGFLLGPVVITSCIDLKVYPVIVLSFIVVFTIVIPIYFMDAKHKPKDEGLLSQMSQQETK